MTVTILGFKNKCCVRQDLRKGKYERSTMVAPEVLKQMAKLGYPPESAIVDGLTMLPQTSLETLLKDRHKVCVITRNPALNTGWLGTSLDVILKQLCMAGLSSTQTAEWGNEAAHKAREGSLERRPVWGGFALGLGDGEEGTGSVPSHSTSAARTTLYARCPGFYMQPSSNVSWKKILKQVSNIYSENHTCR